MTSKKNSREHEPNGDYMPMAIPAISRYEVLDGVQVKNFRLGEKKRLL